MRGILALLTSLFILSVSAFAAQWSPYVGGALQYDIAFAHYNLKSLTRSGTLHDFGCWGSQCEVGMSNANLSVYGGYHFSTSSVYVREYAILAENQNLRQVASQVEENSWKEKRALLGVRWHMNGSGNYPVKPVIGFALTYGKSRLGWTETTRDYPSKVLISSFDVSRNSTYNLGTMIEFGMLIETRYKMDFTVLAQLHRFEADFGHAVPYVPASHYVVLLPSVRLGMRYVLPSLSFGK